MLFILFALKSEAQAFVDRFKLKKKKDLNYTLFYNNHITAIVSGVGVLNASNAVSFLLNNYTIDSDDIFINIGICGASNEYKIGELIQISQVNYKNRSCKLNNQTNILTTLDYKQVQADFKIVDMEAFGFCNALKDIKNNKYIFKIVSDHFNPNNLSKDFVKMLIFNKIDLIYDQLSI